MNYLYPEFYARFYDLIYHQQRDGIDNDFFLKEIKDTKGKVLEIGVGTGRIFKDALDLGSDIYGIDISQPMIDVLLGKINSSQHYRISHQNILDFSFGFGFDLIIAPFHMFMHILDKKEQVVALNNVCSHLNQGGRFIFDVFVPNLNALINGLNNITDFQGEYLPGKIIKRTVSTNPDLHNQIINITFSIEWDENNNEKCEEWNVPLRYFFRYELEHLVERSDFRDYTILGDYKGNELNKDSKEFIVVCRKNDGRNTFWK